MRKILFFIASLALLCTSCERKTPEVGTSMREIDIQVINQSDWKADICLIQRTGNLDEMALTVAPHETTEIGLSRHYDFRLAHGETIEAETKVTVYNPEDITEWNTLYDKDYNYTGGYRYTFTINSDGTQVSITSIRNYTTR